MKLHQFAISAPPDFTLKNKSIAYQAINYLVFFFISVNIFPSTILPYLLHILPYPAFISLILSSNILSNFTPIRFMRINNNIFPSAIEHS